ncbi:hypothetical protein ACFQGA_14200 [Marinobacter koreensis]
MRRMLNDFSLTAVVAGFLAVLVSYSGPLAIFSRRPPKPACRRT